MSDKKDSDFAYEFKIWSEFKPENLLFSVPCSSFYYHELSYLVINAKELGSKRVRLYFYLKVICRHYREPPPIEVLEQYVPGFVSSDIKAVEELRGLKGGEKIYIPKVVIRKFLLERDAMGLLVSAMLCFLTDRRGTFQLLLRTQAIPKHQISRVIASLKKDGLVESLHADWTDKTKRGAKYRWAMLKA